MGVGQPQDLGLAGDGVLDQAGDVVGGLVGLDHQLLGAVGDPELDLHMPLVLLVGLASAVRVGEAERSTRSLKGGRARTESDSGHPSSDKRGKRGPSVLLTGPFGGLTDDVREFLRCLADEGLPLTGWGELDPASLRTVRERLPGGGAGGDGPDGLALARRRTTLLRSLCDAGRLTEAEAGLLQLTDLGRLLWHERDALLQELAGLPPGQVE